MVLAVWAAWLAQPVPTPLTQHTRQQLFGNADAQEVLATLPVHQRSSGAGYRRQQFGEGWGEVAGCSVREVVLARDLTHPQIDGCKVLRGVLHDPYTGRTIQFQRGPESSQAVQIDHVVALSDAWQKGAQQLSLAERQQFANDPLNLLAVDGAANQLKSNADAAEWLPQDRAFHCQYVARQIAVKKKYRLWVTEAEKTAMQGALRACGS